ncbi:ester cyclase [Geothrix sp. PMB-07]|uniref:ester cyclase n=1 Tax=Geothrix sp. PMB-07 TaxID=3068640 RepID=UPI0027413E06|nr:ester cyclase [Geothrix sp. PMB-07]WLT30991.1 ester cyclase [Geothrix sp. PMB-07]
MSDSSVKAIVRRFNREVIEEGNMAVFAELVAPDFINHTAVPGTPAGRDGFAAFFTGLLRTAFTEIRVHIHDQVGEGDKVATRKTIEGLHTGSFLGRAATGRRIRIRVTDIVVIREGRYCEHWGSADLHGALQQIEAEP